MNKSQNIEVEQTPHLDAALERARVNMMIVDIRLLDTEIALLQMEDKELRER